MLVMHDHLLGAVVRLVPLHALSQDRLLFRLLGAEVPGSLVVDTMVQRVEIVGENDNLSPVVRQNDVTRRRRQRRGGGSGRASLAPSTPSKQQQQQQWKRLMQQRAQWELQSKKYLEILDRFVAVETDLQALHGKLTPLVREVARDHAEIIAFQQGVASLLTKLVSTTKYLGSPERKRSRRGKRLVDIDGGA
eukprot:gene18631-22451_t